MELISGYSSESDHENNDDSSEKKAGLKRVDKAIVDDSIPKKQKLGNKTSCYLPVPADIQAMFLTEPDLKDDLEKHGGRIRTFSHERGNWASLVYAYVSPYQEECLRDLTQYIINLLDSTADFHPCEDLHLSLSRTFILRHHWIEPLVKSLREKLAGCPRSILPCGDLKWYSNDEKTRTFIAIYIADEDKVLTMYTKAIDSALGEFKLPCYYEQPSFHISLAWCLGDMTEKLNKRGLDSDVQKKVLETAELIEGINIQELQLKTGNKMFSIPLSKC